MGAVAECVRTWPGAIRSLHPLTSFAGVGPAATDLLAGHELTSLLGEQSPLARLEAHGARTLLLGVGYDRATAFHLAEYRLPTPPLRVASCVVGPSHQERMWLDFETADLDSSDFPSIGHDLENESDCVRVGTVGAAAARLLPIPEAVGFAHRWMLRHRRGGTDATSQHEASDGGAEDGQVTRTESARTGA